MRIVAGGGGEDDALPGGDAHQGDGVAPGHKEHPPKKPQLRIKWYQMPIFIGALFQHSRSNSI